MGLSPLFPFLVHFFFSFFACVSFLRVLLGTYSATNVTIHLMFQFELTVGAHPMFSLSQCVIICHVVLSNVMQAHRLAQLYTLLSTEVDDFVGNHCTSYDACNSHCYRLKSDAFNTWRRVLLKHPKQSPHLLLTARMLLQCTR